MVRRTKFRALGGSRMYNEAIRGRQNGNPGLKVCPAKLPTSGHPGQRRISLDVSCCPQVAFSREPVTPIPLSSRAHATLLSCFGEGWSFQFGRTPRVQRQVSRK